MIFYSITDPVQFLGDLYIYMNRGRADCKILRKYCILGMPYAF